MKRDGKYRFNLQFSDNKEENVRVGELLERLGNRKSLFVINAINEYLLFNPELLQENGEIRTLQFSNINNISNTWKDMVRTIVEEQVSKYQREDILIENDNSVILEGQNNIEEGMLTMINNLEDFLI